MAEGFPMGMKGIGRAVTVGTETMGLGAAVFPLRLDRTGITINYSAEPVYDVEATAFRKFFPLPDDGWKWRFDIPDFSVRFIALDLHHIQDMGTTWQTGHPFGGQTIAVRKVTRKRAGAGYTGTRATSIGGFFGLPPPAEPPASTFVSFIRYGQQEIPTSLVLPCAGPGQVTFIALPLDPSERDVAVPVVFVGQP